MRYYPVLLDVENKKALVVGGGQVAQRKAESLLEQGARVYVVSQEVTPELENLIKDGKVVYLGKQFEEAQLEGIFLIIAATDDHYTNQKISRSARKRGILVNAVDQPEDCDFIIPSVLNRGDLVIAVSTSGKSPALSKRIRRELEGQFGREYASFLKLMGRVRSKVLSKRLSQKENSRIFHELVNSGMLRAIANQDRETVKSILEAVLPPDVGKEAVIDDLMDVQGQ